MDRKQQFGAAAIVALAVASQPALAQRANENAITSADDAFGTSIGNESIGLYSSSDVRGFSPSNAGNDRIEGVYFDREGFISPRLVAGSTIRVGLAAQGYPFPAPTGIVDYRLRPAGDKRIISLVGGLREYGSPDIELDAQIPILGDRLSLAAGASYELQEKYDGTDISLYFGSAILHWRPAPGIEIIPFWAGQAGQDAEQGPTILAAGNYLPPEIPRRKYLGQDWVRYSNNGINTGVIVKARLSDNWALSGGAVYSVHSTAGWFAQVFGETTQDGMTNKRVIADPGQRGAAKSGEMRIARTIDSGAFHHRIIGSVRIRHLNSFYGGDAAPFNVGRVPLLDTTQVPYPGPFTFGAFTYDHVRQTTYGLTYEARYRNLVNLSVAMQRTDYKKTTEPPESAAVSSDSKLWLPSVSLSVTPTGELTFYADYTKGLEETGSPPNSAVNRTEVMPAIQTKQTDAGVRWTFVPGATLVAGYFDIQKPYLNLDEHNVFMVLGNVRHRGYELSLTANPVSNLNVVAGAVLMKPRVSGAAVDIGRVGPKPVGKSSTTIRGNANYRLPFFSAVSLDAAVSYTGSVVATSNNLVHVPAYTLFDLGARYRFHIAEAPATLRVQMLNVGNVFSWKVLGNSTYDIIDGRRVVATIAADF